MSQVKMINIFYEKWHNSTRKMAFVLKLLFTLWLVVLPSSTALQFPDCINGPLASNLVCDPGASPQDRAAALVGAMNISEKLVNMVK
jgi:hypothetical protein